MSNILKEVDPQRYYYSTCYCAADEEVVIRYHG